MRHGLDLTTTAGRFRVVALAEAFSWIGLLVGMYFKYLGSPRTEIGVKVFGPVHGALFVAFLVVALLAGRAFGWNPATWFLALLGAFLPLGTVMFVIWADRRGKLGTGGRAGRVAVPDLSP
jgi:integral membrane protein